MSIQLIDDLNVRTVIIYKTYTPQRQAYALTYYQQNKQYLRTKQREYYQEKKDEMKQDPNFKEKSKKANEKYMNKLKDNPEQFEKYKQKRKDYYNSKKLN